MFSSAPRSRYGPSRITEENNTRFRLVIGGHCGREHLLTEDNVYIYPDGKLACKQCRIRSSRKVAGSSIPADVPVGIWNRDKTKCPQNHDYDFVKTDGSRGCSICLKETRFKSRAKKYGMSPEELKEMLEKSGDQCSICKQTSDLHIDHNHITGKVRNLLCNNCNNLLGRAKDSIIVLRSAIEYLQQYGDSQ